MSRFEPAHNPKRSWKPAPAQRRRHSRPRLEALEARRLLATVQWISTTSGDWATASNWSSGTVPGPNDDVVINVSGATPTITISTGGQSVSSLTCSDPLTLSGGSLTLAAASTISGPLSLNGGTLVAGTSLTLSGAATWTAGTLNLNSNTVTNTGTMTITAGAGLTLLSPTVGTLVNNGTIDQTGTLTCFFHPQITNNATGIYDFTGDGAIVALNGGGSIVNSGLLEKTGGTGTFSIGNGNPLNNQGGTVLAASGILSIAGGGANTGGVYNASAGATLDLSDGTAGNASTYSGTYSGAGAGVVNIGTGELEIGAAGATFNFPAGLFQWSSGTLGLNLNTLTNTGSMTIAGSGVTLNGTDNGFSPTGGTLINNGVIDQGGPLTMVLHAQITNNASGTFDLTGDVGLIAGNGGGTVVNSGLLEKTGGTGTSSIGNGIPLNNQGGTVSAASGILSIAGGGTNTGGAYNASAGATIDLSDGTAGNASVYSGTYTGSGAGAVNIGSGELEVGAAGATFDFPAGLFQWSSGTLGLNLNTLTNTGSMTIAGTGVTLNGSDNGFASSGGSLVNNGVIDQSGPLTLNIIPKIINSASGTYDFTSNAGFVAGDGGGTVVNSGLLEKTGGAGTSAIGNGIPLNNQGGTVAAASGILSIAGGGTDTGGVYNASAGATLDLSDGTGGNASTYSGTYTGAGAGAVNIGSGELEVGAAGATFDFAPGLFQWSSGLLGLNLNTLTNTGSMTIAAGSGLTLNGSDNGFASSGGSLINNGVIDQTGPVTLNIIPQVINTATGVYDFTGDGGIVAGDGGGTIVNAGVFEKTGGTGDSSVGNGVPFTNLGATLAATTGTLEFIGAGTFNGGTYNTAPGGALDLAAQSTSTCAGTFLGGGGGTIAMSGGAMNIGPGGLLLKLTNNTFLWSGGHISSALGNLTNYGTMVLDSPTDLVFDNDGTLDNFGTILQTGPGNLGLHSDSLFPTTLKIEPGAVYNIEADSGIVNSNAPFGGTTALVNLGVIEKTSGTGVSTLLINGTITNQGVITAGSGTLTFSGAIAELSGQTLTGGAWGATGGGNLAFPTGTNLTTNQGALSLAGAGSTLGGIANLALNSGSLTVTNGASLTTAGDFTNSGSLTLGPAASLSVTGNYTQDPSGSLTIGIAGAPATGQFGLLHVTGTAILAGGIGSTAESGFNLVSGESYTIATYRDQTGGSTLSFAGLFQGRLASFQPQVESTSIVLTTTANAAELVPQPPTLPATGTVGQIISVSDTINNTSGNPAGASWVDSYYLSPQPELSASSVLLGRVNQTTGVAAHSSYNSSLTAAIPPVAPGNYYLVVVADSQGLVPMTDRSQDVSASATPILVSVPTLPLNGSVSGTIAAGQSLLYQVTLPAAQNVVLTESLAVAGSANLFEKYQTLPSSASFDKEIFDAGSPNVSIYFSNTQAGTYYILLQGTALAGSGSSFTLSDAISGLSVAGVSPSEIIPSNPWFPGDTINTTLTITGTDFTPSTTVELVGGPNGIAEFTLEPVSTTFVNSTTIWATFNNIPESPEFSETPFQLGPVITQSTPPSYYQVRAFNSGQKVVSPTDLVVYPNVGYTYGGIYVPQPNQSPLSVSVYAPSAVRPDQVAFATITYTNTGSSDIPAPLLLLSATNGVLKLPDQASFGGGLLEVLANNPNGPAGVLPPGASGTIEVEIQGTTAGGTTSLSVYNEGAYAAPNDLAGQSSRFQLPGIPTAAWNAIYANFLARAGGTTTSFQAMLDQDATYLSRLGIYTNDVTQLIGFELAMDGDFGAIAQRYESGYFGMGQSTLFDATATTDSSGDITILDQGAAIPFLAGPGGTYINPTGNGDSLSALLNGNIQFTDPYGNVTTFLPTGQFLSLADRNGNTLTANYTSGKLSGVTDSAGETYAITLNAQGRITQVAKPTGQVINYAYDSTGTYMTSTSTEGLTTSFTYVTGGTPQQQNALASITSPDGVTLSYTYDSQGRLIGTSENGGALPETFSYNLGQVTVTDALGDASSVLLNQFGQVAQTQDALGNVQTFTYNSAGQLVGEVGPTGGVSTFGFDSAGNVTSLTSPLGNQTQGSFGGPLGTISQITDPLGNVTQFTNSSTGNPTSITFADGSQTTSQYNAAGRLTANVARNGMASSYTYNALGQVTAETLADGSQITFTYAANQQVASMTDSTGTTTYTYNSNNQLAATTDPAGVVLSYAYNAAGRLVKMSDSSGYTVQYVYNAIGQLTQLEDASGDSLVTYAYDAAGRLSTATMSNGTSTSYTYDAAGDVTGVTNRGPGNTVLSSFAYAYNALGERTSMTTALGTTQYAYDLSGRLTSATLPGGQALSYEYDAADNLVAVTSSTGGPTDYTTNNLNEYTSSGGTTYTYNVNGDLTSATSASGTTNYTYNAQGQLVGVTSPSGSWSYVYNGLGQLVGENDNGTQVTYQRDPLTGAIVGEFSATGAVISHFVQGLGLAEQIQASGTVDAYSFDGQGNTVAITGSNGAVLDQYSYSPWGQVSSTQQSVSNPFTFVGQLGVASSGSGLSIMGQRAYDPTLGRFLQPDPTGYLGGSSNLYQYAANNPINEVDPSGNVPAPINGAEILNEQFVQNLLNSLKTAITPAPNYSNLLSGPTGYDLPTPQSFMSVPEGGVETAEFSNLTVTEESNVFLTPVGGGAIVALQGPTLVAGIGTAVALKNQLNQLQGLPQVPGISDSLSPLDNAALVHSLSFTPSSTDLTLPLGNNPDIPSPTITFQNGVNNPNYKKLSQDLFNDPDIGPEILHDMFTNDKTFDQAVQDVLANVPKAQQIAIQDVLSHDPNDIFGPQGTGAQGFVAAGRTLPYLIEFTNQASATAPAQTVTVTQQLSPNLDWTTFQLGSIAFGSTVIHVPSGLNTYHTQVDETAALGVLVDITAGINLKTGLVTWTFTSLDPKTLDLIANPLAGFLPPDVVAPEGEGYVSYTVAPRAGATSNQVINAQATVVFDTNAPISTRAIVNTIDNQAPMSSVAALPATIQGNVVNLSWSGSDAGGPGISGYSVFYTDNGQQPQPLVTNTTATSATFVGQVGHQYTFYSIAVDNVGLAQPVPNAPQAFVTLVQPQSSGGTNPPPPAALSSVTETFNKHHQLTAITAVFNEAITSGQPTNAGLYALLTQGKKHSFTTKGVKHLPIRFASYNPVQHTVTITPRKPIVMSKPIELTINGAAFGSPGDSAIVLLKGRSNLIERAALSAFAEQPTTPASQAHGFHRDRHRR